jgi:hypothetical protein
MLFEFKKQMNELLQFIPVYFSKDVRLPIQLQRAMAAEAEATREAKAKVRQIKKMSG